MTNWKQTKEELQGLLKKVLPSEYPATFEIPQPAQNTIWDNIEKGEDLFIVNMSDSTVVSFHLDKGDGKGKKNRDEQAQNSSTFNPPKKAIAAFDLAIVGHPSGWKLYCNVQKGV